MAFTENTYLSSWLNSRCVGINNKAGESFAGWTFRVGICAGQQEVPRECLVWFKFISVQKPRKRSKPGNWIGVQWAVSTHQLAFPPLVIHIFCPLTTYSSPIFTARVLRPATSEPAPGSVTQYACTEHTTQWLTRSDVTQVKTVFLNNLLQLVSAGKLYRKIWLY